MEFQFEPQEWVDCWFDFAESIPDSPAASSDDQAHKFFRSRYTNSSEADWKCDRFLRAYRYLDRNLDAFEKGTGVLGTSKRFSFDSYVLIGLYRFFASANDQQINNEPPPKLIIAAAEEQRRGRPDKAS